jgi:hypothetical protein
MYNLRYFHPGNRDLDVLESEAEEKREEKKLLPIIKFPSSSSKTMSTTTTTTPNKERERKPQTSADGTSSMLVFRNLPSTTTSANFSTFVSSLAPAFVVTKKTDSGIQCEGYGFVTFTEKPDAINLVNNPPKYNSHTVTVAYAKPRQRRQQEEPKPKRVQLSKDPSSGFFLTPFFGRGNGQGLPGLRVLPAARRARSGKLIT